MEWIRVSHSPCKKGEEEKKERKKGTATEWGLGRLGTGLKTTMQWTEIRKISCLLSSCTNSHFPANYVPFCGVGAISSIIAVVLLYPWQSKGIHEAKLTQCMCLGYTPWDQPPDKFQEWVSMPEFILFCLQTSQLSDLAKKKKKKALHVILFRIPHKNHISGLQTAAC